MKINTNPITGCRDFMPFDAEKRQAVMNVILETYKENGFLQIKTPVLESLDLLSKNDEGENSTKLMFRTIKRGEKLDLAKPNLTEKDVVEEGLRYDLTVPLARFYANNKSNLPYPFKATQCDESFRAERPQKGRYRQFTQCDIDILGEESILAEIEVISTSMNAFKNLGLSDLVVKINSRKILEAIILRAGFTQEQVTEVCIVVDKIDKIGLEGVEQELVKRDFDKLVSKGLCNILEKVRANGLESLKEQNIAEQDVLDMQELIAVLKQILPEDFEVRYDVGIVRGQAYYTGTVFEVFTKEGLYKGALCGGGRYDTMLEKMIGEKVPAMGVGLGLDTTLLVMEEKQVAFPKTKKKIALTYDKNEPISNIMQKKQQLIKQYQVSLLPQIKNQKELERKLVLNGFDGFISMSNTEIKWF